MKRLIVIMIMSFTSVSYGALSSDSDSTYSYVYDDATNLDWLTLDETRGYSYNQILDRLSGDLSGWEFADENQLFTLFKNAGFSQVNLNTDGFTYNRDDYEAARDLQDLLGYTYNNSNFTYIESGGLVLGGNFGVVTSLSTDNRVYTRNNIDWSSKADQGFPGIGSFLIRTHVADSASNSAPLSSSVFVVLGTGLLFGLVRRRK